MFPPSSPSKCSKKRIRHSQSMPVVNELCLHSCESSFAPVHPPGEARSDNLKVLPKKMPKSSRLTSGRRLNVPNASTFTSDVMDLLSIRWTKTQRHPIALIVNILLIMWLIVLFAAFSFDILQSPDHLSMWLGASTAEQKQVLGGAMSVTVGPPLIRTTTHSIPLPLPKEKATVVLMNFSRPRMIRDSSMMRTLLSHPNVDEVLLLHANPKTAFEFVHPKVVNIDAIEHNDEIGLSLRFYFCQMAKNSWVLHVDDDMEFTTAALNELFIEFGRNPHRIVGRFGRSLTPGNSFNGYNSIDRHKSSEVVLTKLMLMERNICGSFFEYASLLWDDVVLNDGEGPLWNGEDIFMSLVANHVYGPPSDGRKYNNYAMDWLEVWQADDSLKDYDNGKLDISGGMSGLRFWDWRWWQTVFRRNRHYSYRGQLWQTAKSRLQKIRL